MRIQRLLICPQPKRPVVSGKSGMRRTSFDGDVGMERSHEFLKMTLDTMSEHIAVIDETGLILYVNSRWRQFAEQNACTPHCEWKGQNYLSVCDRSAASGDELAGRAAAGIRDLINSQRNHFYLEYPCDSPEQARWFMMRVTRFSLCDVSYFVISHQDITERKQAEELVSKLARSDGLTGVANRRCFDEFLRNEWRRCARLGLPVSLAIIDIDYFKLVNDTYGHQSGDDCLRQVGQLLSQFAKRPTDICARYGGEEFALVMGNTSIEQARALLEPLNAAIKQLALPNRASPIASVLTASVGLACLAPRPDSSEDALLALADAQLYAAKAAGRNQLAAAS